MHAATGGKRRECRSEGESSGVAFDMMAIHLFDRLSLAYLQEGSRPVRVKPPVLPRIIPCIHAGMSGHLLRFGPGRPSATYLGP